jgi:hypothetical protein
MNFITHSTIYALYPHATFQSGLNLHLVCEGNPTDQATARDKYDQRGWTSVPELDPKDLLHPPSAVYARSYGGIAKQAFTLGARWLGDRLTLSIQLDGFSTASTLRDRDFDSWTIESSDRRSVKGIPVELTTYLLKLPSSKAICVFDSGLAYNLAEIMPALQKRLRWQVDHTLHRHGDADLPVS